MKNYAGIKILSERLARKKHITVKLAEEQVKDLAEVFEDLLVDPNYDGIQLIDFLTLQRKVRAPRIGRNPRTKEEVKIPERTDIKCVLGKKFEGKLNK